MATNKCEHCGADNGKNPVIWNQKAFCCNGCVSVYQIINQHKLYKYYQLENNPGIKIDQPDFGQKFAYLDNAEICNKLYDFREGTQRKVTLYIPSIHCSSCIWLLENLQLFQKGVLYSQVQFVKKEVTILFDESQVSLRQLVELLASVHYVPLISLQSIERKKVKSVNKSLFIKLGVAAFCFGNVMLFSFPEYLSAKDEIDPIFQLFFRYINFLFAVPVLFYSASDYYLSAFKNIVRGILNIDLPVTIGMIALFTQSTYEIFSGTGSGYMDSLTGFVFFLLIGKWYQAKTYQALSFDRNYKSYFPIAVTLLTPEGEKIVELKQLKSGDKILIRNQELIPADSLLLKGKANIDYSFVTGESVPIAKSEGAFIYAGGKQLGEAIELEIKNEVEQSKLTQLWNKTDLNSTEKSTYLSLIDKVSKNFTIAVLFIATFAAIFWYITDSNKALFVFTSVLIVACPCAIALSMPFALGNMMRIFGNKGLYLKNYQVLEKLALVNELVFDKTGTLTYSGLSYITVAENKNIPDNHKQLLVSVLRNSSHPSSLSILKFLDHPSYLPLNSYTETPGQGIEGIRGTDVIKIGSGSFVNVQTINAVTNQSLVYASINNQIVYCFQLENKYREGLDTVLNSLSQNYKLHLLSGDSVREHPVLEAFFGKKMFFSQSPSDKLNYVSALKKYNVKVLMIGDGLNDAGALMESYAGISIADDVYHFTPSCDAIMQSDKFNMLHKFLKLSKNTIQIVKVSYLISLLYNIIGLFFAISGNLTPIVAAILMPASSVSVIIFVTFAGIIISNRVFSK